MIKKRLIQAAIVGAIMVVAYTVMSSIVGMVILGTAIVIGMKVGAAIPRMIGGSKRRWTTLGTV